MKKNWAKIILIHFHLVDTQNEPARFPQSPIHYSTYFCNSNSIHAHCFKERVSTCTTVIQLLMYGVVWKSFHESQLNCGEGGRDKISNINSAISIPPPSLTILLERGYNGTFKSIADFLLTFISTVMCYPCEIYLHD